MWAREAPADHILLLAKRIVKDFCTTESVMEVNMDEKSRAKILALSEEPTVNMFDSALVAVDRDIARSLQAFYVSDVFLTYFDNRQLVDDLVGHEDEAPLSAARQRSQTVGGQDETREEILAQVRKAFQTSEVVFLKRHFDITSSFTYKVHLRGKDGAHIGYGVQRGSTFYFYNLQEEQVLKVLSAALLGKTSHEEEPVQVVQAAQPAAARDVDDDVAGSGCCGGGGASRPAAQAPPPQAVEKAAPAVNLYVRNSKGESQGPIKQTSLQLLFRYHVLPLSTMASLDNKAWKPIDDIGDIFSASRRIETIDPTEVPSF